MDSNDQARIAARYPKRTLSDVLIGGAVGVALLVAVVLVVLAGIERANPPVVAMVRAFEVLSPATTEVELVVQRSDPSKPATCFVYAQAVSYERVAEKLVEIPADTDELKSVSVKLQTIKEATSVSVGKCSLLDE